MSSMRQSALFTKTRREAPKTEVSKNAELLIRAGYIHKEMAGAYSFLPLGLRVLENIKQIIREEMNAIGGQEIFLTALQDKDVWEKTGRWSDAVVDNWFKTTLRAGGEVGLGFTHEEPLTRIMTSYIHSYRDLPRYAYQFQTKFRNEERAKSGIMRGREFLMKDLYSFSRDEVEHEIFYERIQKSYINIFNRLGIGDRTYLTFASGGSFSRFSHEFQTETEVGEDTIYITKEKKDGKFIAINKEVFTDEPLKELGLPKEDFRETRAVEVGNIFTLGTRFSEALGLMYLDEAGKKQPVFMGSYGIGPSRLVGTLVEVKADEKGIVWPASVAPFLIHLMTLGDDPTVTASADALYGTLTAAGIEVLYDDRAVSAGEKFADAELMGMPYRVVVSEKTMKENKVELTRRDTGEGKLVPEQELLTLR
jgi:prolyl-tRNA synthetase